MYKKNIIHTESIITSPTDTPKELSVLKWLIYTPSALRFILLQWSHPHSLFLCGLFTSPVSISDKTALNGREICESERMWKDTVVL